MTTMAVRVFAEALRKPLANRFGPACSRNRPGMSAFLFAGATIAGAANTKQLVSIAHTRRWKALDSRKRDLKRGSFCGLFLGVINRNPYIIHLNIAL